MNKELVNTIQNKMKGYAVKVNDLISMYENYKSMGASISDLNEIATKANELNQKYMEVKNDYDEYIFNYKKLISSKDSDSYDSIKNTFYICQSRLLAKYGVKSKNNTETKSEKYTHHKPKKGSKLVASALILASVAGLGYGLTSCSFMNNEPPAIVDIDNSEQEPSKSEGNSSDNEEVINQEPLPSNEENTEINKEEETEEVNKGENQETNIPSDTEVIDTDDETLSTNDFAYLKETSSLYDKKTDDKVELGQVEKFQKVLRINSDGNYDYVQTEDLQYGYIESSKLEVLPDMYVEVDISDQTVELYKDKDVILTTLCVTGKDSTPTRIGYFPIKYKTYDTYLKGPGYKSHVYYWMPFDGGIGLHDAAWRDEFGGDIHFKSGSHGCVNMPHDAAETIYNNVSTGTKVLVHN